MTSPGLDTSYLTDLRKERILTSASAQPPGERTSFDFVIVGGGTAGCVLANRLSETDVDVLLIEAGPPDDCLVAALSVQLLQSPAFLHLRASSHLLKLPSSGGHHILMGSVWGGSSSVNGSVYTRGFPQDFERWEQLCGSSIWGWEAVRRDFESLERSMERAQALPAGTLPTPLSTGHEFPAVGAILEACRDVGLPVLESADAIGPSGAVTYAQFLQAGPMRVSASTAFLRPALSRKNLFVASRTVALSVAVCGQRATGVVCERDGVKVAYSAKKEVVLCAGALISPHLLMASGIGPSSLLAQLGIPIVCDLPVGRLEEHVAVGLNFGIRCGPAGDPTPMALPSHLESCDAVLKHLVSAQLTGKSWRRLIAFITTNPRLPLPDVELEFFFTDSIIHVSVIILQPRTTGRIVLGSADPRQPPLLQFDLGQLHEDDRRTLVAGISFVQRLIAHPLLKHLNATDLDHLQTDDLRAAHVRNTVRFYNHPVATCSMGKDSATSVVDSQLTVHGMSGLRIADNSIVPCSLHAHTMSLAMLIGWKAAASLATIPK